MSADSRRATVTTSWDDGHVYDFAVANLLHHYALPGTFYIAPRNQELPLRTRLSDRAIRELASSFEIGGHTLTHERIAPLGDAAATEEIQAGKAYLEDCLGLSLVSFCYPGGSYRPEQTRLVEAAGFTRARTVARHRTDATPRAMEVPTTFHAYQHLLDGPAAVAMAGHNVRLARRWFFNWDDWAIAIFDRVVEAGGVFHLWGHSWEIEARDDWGRLERVMAHIARRPQVDYIRNGDLAVQASDRHSHAC
jgi:peptidoglycan-N-acetylglucosamine deacetylase